MFQNSKLFRFVRYQWRTCWSCIIAIFLITLLVYADTREAKCGYIIILVAAFWLLEPVPIAVTALLPVVLFPLMGVMDSNEVCENYMKEIFMMLIGGLIMVIAVENCKLHERVALKVLLLIGTEIKWLMLGFMITTMAFSMWISNTASTAMMVPIVEAIVEEIMQNVQHREKEETVIDLPLNEINEESLTESREKIEIIEIRRSTKSGEKKKAAKLQSSPIKIALLLSVCYSANIGGTGTLMGATTNLVLKGLLEDLYPESKEITFATWMMYNVPGMVLCVLIGWIYLYVIYVRCSNFSKVCEEKSRIRDIIFSRYKELGSINFHEGTVIALFSTQVSLWIFRDPKFLTGWAEAINPNMKIGDSVPAIAVCLLLFFIPSEPSKWATGPRILEWKEAQTKLPWGLFILVGGGFALADAAKKSGLSTLLGNELATLSTLSPIAMVMVICLMTAMLTEILSNTATAAILLPIISQMAVSMKTNPLFLMLPAVITCSYAFMLPIATIPNAIVFEIGNMKTIDMVKPGFVMNIICCCVQVFMLNTLGVAMFNLNEFPDWARESYSPLSTNGSDFFKYLNSTHPEMINSTELI